MGKDNRNAAVGPWWLRWNAHLPLSVLYALCALLTWTMRHVLRYRVAVARDNLRRCFPTCSEREIDALLARHYRQLGELAAEFVKTAAMSAGEMCARVPVINLSLLQAELVAGRSVLLLGAHQCNWEWSLQAVTLQIGVPLHAAYKPLHDAAADRQLRALRSRFGARLIAAKRLLREVVRGRDQLRALALIADQVPSSSEGRLWLEFLGRDTAFYPGPGEIARSTGYAAFFAAMTRRRRGHYQIELQPICAAGERPEPLDFTKRYARLLEQLIRAHPSDWTWTHRRWKISRACADAGAGAPAVS